MDSDSDNGVLQAPRRKPSPIPPKELIPGSLRVPHDPGVDKGGQLSKEQIDYSLDDIDTELEDLDSDISLTDHMWGEHYQDLLNTRPENPEQAGSLDSSKMEAKWDLHRETENSNKTWTQTERDDAMLFLKERGYHQFMNEYLVKRKMTIRELLYAFNVTVPSNTRAAGDKKMLSILKQVALRTMRKRDKLKRYGTIEDAVNLLRNSRKILVLSGAGISVSCGIPDFRSRNGLYAMLKEKGDYNLDDPQQMFDIRFFREDPDVFYSFAHKIYPSNFKPSPCHRFIRALETRGKLLRNYTQNIDTLETLAGVTRILQCHGSFATASCIECHTKVPGTDIKDDVLNQRVALCKVCKDHSKPKSGSAGKKKGKKKKKCDWWESDEYDEPIGKLKYPPGIMKPDITFFGEKLTDEFDEKLFQDRSEVDLLVVMGTSLNVAPVSDILTHLPHSVPRIIINKTPLLHVNADINLLGNADVIVRYLSLELGWDISEPTPPGDGMQVVDSTIEKPSYSVVQTTKDTVAYLFEGAEVARILGTEIPSVWDSYAWAEVRAALKKSDVDMDSESGLSSISSLSSGDDNGTKVSRKRSVTAKSDGGSSRGRKGGRGKSVSSVSASGESISKPGRASGGRTGKQNTQSKGNGDAQDSRNPKRQRR